MPGSVLGRAPLQISLTVEKGVDLNFARALGETVLDNGRPVSRPPSIVGARFRLEILQDYEDELIAALDTETGEITVQDAADACLQFFVPAYVTATWPTGGFVCTFRRIEAGEVFPLGRGPVSIIPGR